MAKKYSKKSQEFVEEAMHEFKRGKLESGSGKKVKSKDQAIAIGLSEAREAGAKVPDKKSGDKKKNSKSTSSKKSKKTGKSSSGSSKKKAA